MPDTGIRSKNRQFSSFSNRKRFDMMRELAFEHMVERGLADSRKGRVISNEEMRHRIRTWQR